MAMLRTTGLVLFWDCIVSLFGKVLGECISGDIYYDN